MKDKVINAVLFMFVASALLYAVIRAFDEPQVYFNMDTGKPVYIVEAHGVKVPVDKDHPLPHDYERVWIPK